MPLAPRYFPVDAPHWMPGPQPTLGKAEAGSTCIELDDERADYLTAKRPAAEAGTSGPFRASEVGDDERRVGEWLRETVQREHPAAMASAPLALDQIVSGIQEDLVIMRRPPGAPAADAIATYLHVSFPTGWCPACTCGRSFLEIHAPVPPLHHFAGSHRPNLARSLFSGSRYTVRFVWTLTPDARLDRRRCPRDVHRSLTPAPSWADAATAWLRVERQVVVPLDDALSVFLIRIYRHDVRSLAPEQRRILRASLGGMEDSLATYKGLLRDKTTIETFLA